MERMKQARKSRGWSQSVLAEHIGVSPGTIGRWERGESEPYPYHQHLLSELLGMTPEQLGFERIDEKPSGGRRKPLEPPNTYFTSANLPEIERLAIQNPW